MRSQAPAGVRWAAIPKLSMAQRPPPGPTHVPASAASAAGFMRAARVTYPYPEPRGLKPGSDGACRSEGTELHHDGLHREPGRGVP